MGEFLVDLSTIEIWCWSSPHGVGFFSWDLVVGQNRSDLRRVALFDFMNTLMPSRQANLEQMCQILGWIMIIAMRVENAPGVRVGSSQLATVPPRPIGGQNILLNSSWSGYEKAMEMVHWRYRHTTYNTHLERDSWEPFIEHLRIQDIAIELTIQTTYSVC